MQIIELNVIPGSCRLLKEDKNIHIFTLFVMS